MSQQTKTRSKSTTKKELELLQLMHGTIIRIYNSYDAYFHRPIKKLYFLTPARNQKC